MTPSYKQSGVIRPLLPRFRLKFDIRWMFSMPSSLSQSKPYKSILKSYTVCIRICSKLATGEAKFYNRSAQQTNVVLTVLRQVRLMNENHSSHNHVRKAFVMLNCSRALRPHRSYDPKFFVMKTRNLFHQAIGINAIGSKCEQSDMWAKRITYVLSNSL